MSIEDYGISFFVIIDRVNEDEVWVICLGYVLYVDLEDRFKNFWVFVLLVGKVVIFFDEFVEVFRVWEGINICFWFWYKF